MDALIAERRRRLVSSDENVCKRPRDPDTLRLPADRDAVFASPVAFAAHHKED